MSLGLRSRDTGNSSLMMKRSVPNARSKSPVPAAVEMAKPPAPLHICEDCAAVHKNRCDEIGAIHTSLDAASLALFDGVRRHLTPDEIFHQVEVAISRPATRLP